MSTTLTEANATAGATNDSAEPRSHHGLLSLNADLLGHIAAKCRPDDLLAFSLTALLAWAETLGCPPPRREARFAGGGHTAKASVPCVNRIFDTMHMHRGSAHEAQADDQGS